MGALTHLADKAQGLQDRLPVSNRRVAQIATAAILWTSVVLAIVLLGVVSGLLGSSTGSAGIAAWALLITILTLAVAALHTVVADLSRRRVMLFTHGGTFVRLQRSSLLLSRSLPILYLTVVVALGVNQAHHVAPTSVRYSLAQAATGFSILLLITSTASALLTLDTAPFATSLIHLSAPTADALSPPGSRGRTSNDASVDTEKGPTFLMESEKPRTISPVKQPTPRRSLSQWSTSTASTKRTKLTGKRKPRHPRTSPAQAQATTPTNLTAPSAPGFRPSTSSSTRTTGIRPSTADSTTSRASCFHSLSNPPAEDTPLPPVPVHYTRPKSNPMLVPIVPPRAASRLASRPSGAPPGIGHGRPSPAASLTSSARPGPRHPAGPPTCMRPIRAGSSSTLASRSSRASDKSNASSILRGHHGASGEWASFARAPVTVYDRSPGHSASSLASAGTAPAPPPGPSPLAASTGTPKSDARSKGHRTTGSSSTGGSSARRARASVLSVISSVDEEVERRAERDASFAPPSRPPSPPERSPARKNPAALHARAQSRSPGAEGGEMLRPAPLNVANKHKVCKKRWSREAVKRGSLLLLPPIERFEALGGEFEGVTVLAHA